MGWFRRAKEATPLAATGAAGWGPDDIDARVDGTNRYRAVGSTRREVPGFTLQKARALSVHNYRANPMARAICDTYTSFCVGDSGLTVQSSVPEVADVARRFWDDHYNALGRQQELLLRTHMLMGETALRLHVGQTSGATRYSYIDPEAIRRVHALSGNPMWPDLLTVATISDQGPDETDFAVVRWDDLTERRTGEVLWAADWKALASDRRGYPMLAPVLDWLEAYDAILWNLIDRTALQRYLVWDVTVKGGPNEIRDFVEARKGQHAPAAGTVEVHNENVAWELKQGATGAYEDKVTGASALTSVAAGAGLAKTWLAEPEDANRATALTMAEPVRRRVGGVQNLWLGHMTELVRYAVDQAVNAGRLPALVATAEGERPAAETVTITGPQIASADALINAQVLTELNQSLAGLQSAGLLGPEAAKRAAEKAWEAFVGVPYDPHLDGQTPGNVADYVDARATRPSVLSVVG